MEIINKTPWDTEGLTGLITAFDGLGGLEKVTFDNHQVQPGVRREDQRLFEGSQPYNWQQPNEAPSELYLELVSPKRVKARTSALDRLAFAKDLQSHEVPLPTKVIEQIVHALHVVANAEAYGKDRYTTGPLRKHINGTCDCNKTLPETPIIPGCTKVRTRPPVTMAKLRSKLRDAERSVQWAEGELAKAIEARDKAKLRIERRIERDRKEREKLDRIASKARKR